MVSIPSELFALDLPRLAFLAMEVELSKNSDGDPSTISTSEAGIVKKYDTRIKTPMGSHPRLSLRKLEWALQHKSSLAYKTDDGARIVVERDEIVRATDKLRMELIKDITKYAPTR